MESRLYPVLFITFSSFTTVRSCSCPESLWGKSRDQGIRDDFEFSVNVYTTIVSAADCKCFPASLDGPKCPTILDCVNFAIGDDDTVIENIQKKYECLQGFPCTTNNYYAFPECEHVRNVLASSSTVGKTTRVSLLHGKCLEFHCHEMPITDRTINAVSIYAYLSVANRKSKRFESLKHKQLAETC